MWYLQAGRLQGEEEVLGLVRIAIARHYFAGERLGAYRRGIDGGLVETCS